MVIRLFESMNSLSEAGASLIVNEINNKPDFLLCAASGSSPTMTYRKLALQKDSFPREELKIVKLDEWGAVAINHPGSCETYLQESLIGPLQIKDKHYLSFNSDPNNAEQECRRIQDQLNHYAPIDLSILGLGTNGHIAFNEPASTLQPHCHTVSLSKASLDHPMATAMQGRDIYGLTLGMADLLQSHTILFIISGENKTESILEFLSRKISTFLPASFLWLHPNVHCFIDREACNPHIIDLIHSN